MTLERGIGSTTLGLKTDVLGETSPKRVGGCKCLHMYCFGQQTHSIQAIAERNVLLCEIRRKLIIKCDKQ